MVASYEDRLWNQKIDTIVNKCDMISDRITEAGFQFNDVNRTLETEVEQFASLLEGRIMVVDHNYRIVKDTFGVEDNRYLMTEDVIKTMSGESIQPTTIDQQYMEAFYPVKDGSGEKINGVICVIASCQDITDMGNYMEDQRSRLSTLIIIVSVALSFGVSVFMTRKFKVLNRSVRYIAAGHTDEQIKVVGFTEMKETASAFNDILAKMQMIEDSRQEFVSNVSHELKTPLMSISGYAELMMNGLVEPENIPVFSGRIYDEASRLTNLVTDIIQLSRLDEKSSTLSFEAIDINELAEDVANNLKQAAEKKEITLTYEGCTAVIRGVHQVVYEMFYNLADNAVRYTPQGGHVQISVGREEGKPFYSVKDDGIGIAPNEQKRVFERFYRVDKSHSRSTGGTGLGLSIVKHGASLHNARIQMDSAPGKGTCIRLLF